MTHSLNIDDRPRPILDAFRSVASTVALAGSVATSLVGWGVLTLAQGDAVSALLGAIPGAVALVTSLLAAFRVVAKAEPLVTPTADPRTDDGIALIPAA